MRNIKLTIAYAGTRYSGWQVQNRPRQRLTGKGRLLHKPTIQGQIEGALSKILRQKVSLMGSGRTDAGVHAIAQVAHFKTDTDILLQRLKKSLNGLLPADIAILKAQEVKADFHARFSARSKTYRYLILNEETKNVFLSPWAYLVRFPLDVKQMKTEAGCLRGRHNFKAFQAADRVPRSSVRTIKRISVTKVRRGEGFPFLRDARLIAIEIEADGFLFNMVRNIAGTLLDVGRGRLRPGAVREILEKKERALAGPCVPAKGLYLVDVHY